MNRIFGQKKTSEAAHLPNVANRMDGKVSELDEKISQLNQELASFKSQLGKARAPMQRTIKQRALQTLRRKKMYETQRDNILSQSFNVERATFALETSANTMETVSAMKAATVQLQTNQKNFSIDDVESVQDDMAELLEDMDEIQQSLGRSYGIGEDIDEAELEAELADLEEDWDNETSDNFIATASRQLPAYLQSSSEEVSSATRSAIHGTPQRTTEYELPLPPVVRPVVL